ncbi:MAG: virulence factor SrfB, partial [Succinivibrio sp.]
MLAPVSKTNENATSLIENSGIQFIDMEFVLNPNSSNENEKDLRTVCMVPMLDRGGKESHLALLERTPGGELTLPGAGRDSRKYSDSDSRVQTIEFQNAARMYNGIWFPVPYFSTNVLDEKGLMCPNGRDVGPLNWVRARVVRIDQPHTYRVTYAFDTSLQKDFVQHYFAPSERDRQSGSNFALAWRDGGSELLTPGENGISWVREWAKSVYEDRGCFDSMSGQKLSPETIEENEKHLDHEANYLAMLRVIGAKANPGRVKICSLGRSTEPAVEASLVLDVGNSRSCGLIFEDDGENRTDLLRVSKLTLRDLSAPEQVYDDPFESRIEFSRADFDFDGRSARSGRADAFSWPSLARVGREAVNLANLRTGNEGATGLNSPKRYLWNEKLDKQHDEWSLNPN